MSPQEQEKHLANLLLEERRVRKTIACYASKARRQREVMEALQDPWGADFDTLREQYYDSLDAPTQSFLDNTEKNLKRLGTILKEIKAIDG